LSLKPKKHSDELKMKEKMSVKKSRMNTLPQLPPYTMIVSEGTKTEPHYLEGFVKKINDRYKSISKEPHVEVYGTGKNTKGLIKFIDKQIEKGEWNHFQKFWLVYDKDDFPLDNFDNTQFMAEARKKPQMAVAWSNESIELWFLLHFQDYCSDNGRKQYIEKLNEYFDYSKTREDLFDVIMKNGSLKNAIRRSKKMYQDFLEQGVSSMSAMKPATRMHELVEELEKYLEN